MLVNEMQEEASQVVRNRPDDLPKLGLLMVILATIFMKDNVITDGMPYITIFYSIKDNYFEIHFV